MCLLVSPDAPGAPYNLQPSDVAKDSLTLSWYEPDEDGGSPITGYWVERYEPDHDKWIRCNKLPIKDTNYRYTHRLRRDTCSRRHSNTGWNLTQS